ncbi:MAG: aminotransferase class I/II-fold pyridoxal phosphate-dependent enzyme [Deinococcales bacterium]
MSDSPLDPNGLAFDNLAFDTLQLHAGQERPDPTTGARAVPIYATSSFVFESAEHAANTFADKPSGQHQNQYARMHNPTVEALLKRLIALEGASGGVVLSSGQAASTTVLFSLMAPGGHFILSNQLFGGTYSAINKILIPWGAEVSIVEPNAEAIAGVIQENTLGVWLETIANPSCAVPDIAAIAKVCKAKAVPLIVDNTWGCGGYICQPLALGADIVIHSLTKWIGGHGNMIGGAILEAGRFDWHQEKFPAFSKLDSRGRSYLSRAGNKAFSLRAFDLGLFTMGMTLSPQAAFLALQGLETLSLRVQRSCDSALELAQFLEAHPKVKRVYYAGLPSHPCHEDAKKTLRHGFGAVLSFETHDEASSHRVLDRVKLISHLANIGDAKTVMINPWTTTHSSLAEKARVAAGVCPALLRLSVGLEHPQDLKTDLHQALA